MSSCLQFPKNGIFKWEKELCLRPWTCLAEAGRVFSGCSGTAGLWGRNLPFPGSCGFWIKDLFPFPPNLCLQHLPMGKSGHPNPTFCSVIRILLEKQLLFSRHLKSHLLVGVFALPFPCFLLAVDKYTHGVDLTADWGSELSQSCRGPQWGARGDYFCYCLYTWISNRSRFWRRQFWKTTHFFKI